MEASSHALIEETHKRRATTKEFPEEVVELAEICLSWLNEHNRPITPQTLKQSMVTMGMREHTPDGFIHQVWQFIGGRRDIYALCDQLEIHYQKETEEDEPQEEL